MERVAEDLLPYGLGTPNLVEAAPGYLVDAEILPFLNKLKNEAAKEGFELRIESAYRPFERQLSIWNRKASGELPLLSAEGVPMELADAVIRCFDMAYVFGIDLEAAIKEKHAFNKTRPYLHGRKF